MSDKQTDTHRGWLIEQNWIGEWEACGDGDGEMVSAKTRALLIDEIDEYIYEHEGETAARDCAEYLDGLADYRRDQAQDRQMTDAWEARS
jgi:gamma-glutamyl:cysteine ligase YbdK (ATP-grasp superfamily)